MARIAKFEKISKEQFINDWITTYELSNNAETRDEVERIWENIRLPQRGTAGSAGYDFYAPSQIILSTSETIKIPTGIRVAMDPSYVLMVFPRSGYGTKHRMQLDNTVGIIDSDYYYADNNGHIFIQVSKDSYEHNKLIIPTGSGFAQGIFVPFGLTLDDNAHDLRKGGFGSTDK